MERTLRCPLCGEEYLVRSEEECQAHISNCRAFHIEYGPDSSRAGLVDGFSELSVSQTPPSPVPAVLPTALSDAYDRCALAVLPLVPVQMVQAGVRAQTMDALELIAQLIAMLFNAELKRSPLADESDFDEADLAEVTLGPFLKPLGDDGESVQAAILDSFCDLRQTSAGAGLAAALQVHLLQAMDGFRYCNGCGRSACRMFACTRCKAVRYCGQACQRTAWPAHKLSCVKIQMEAASHKAHDVAADRVVSLNPFDD